MLKFGIIKSWNGRMGKVAAIGESRSYTFTRNDLDCKDPDTATAIGTKVDFQAEGFEAKVVRPTKDRLPFNKMRQRPDYRWTLDGRARSRQLGCTGELFCSYKDLTEFPTLWK